MNRNPSNPNTIGIKIGLPNSSNKGFDIKAGEIESYAFAIGEGYTIYKLGNYLENETVSKGIRILFFHRLASYPESISGW